MPEDGNNAILEFLMNDKKEEVVKKDKERKEDEERRLAEREEDAKRLEQFRDDIVKTVKTEIKTEIKVAIEPIKERQDKAEKEAQNTRLQVETIMEELKSLKEQLAKKEEGGNTSSEGRV